MEGADPRLRGGCPMRKGRTAPRIRTQARTYTHLTGEKRRALLDAFFTKPVRMPPPHRTGAKGKAGVPMCRLQNGPRPVGDGSKALAKRRGRSLEGGNKSGPNNGNIATLRRWGRRAHRPGGISSGIRERGPGLSGLPHAPADSPDYRTSREPRG